MQEPTQPEFVEHRIPRDGHALYARYYPGTGPTFVVMHGFPDNLHIYDRLIPLLVAAGFPVVAFDFLGFGASDKPAGYPYSFSQQLGDLEAVADFFGIEHVVPVGHDAGGIAAIDFALAHPTRVRKLCLLNTLYGEVAGLRLPELIRLFADPELRALAEAIGSDPKQLGWLLGFQQTQFKAGASSAQAKIIDDLVRPIITDNFMQHPSAGPAFATLAAQVAAQVKRNTERVGELDRLGLPATVVWGKGDHYLTVGVAEDLAAHLKASLHVLDANHWVQLDLPEEVARHLLAGL